MASTSSYSADSYKVSSSVPSIFLNNTDMRLMGSDEYKKSPNFRLFQSVFTCLCLGKDIMNWIGSKLSYLKKCHYDTFRIHDGHQYVDCVSLELGTNTDRMGCEYTHSKETLFWNNITRLSDYIYILYLFQMSCVGEIKHITGERSCYSQRGMDKQMCEKIYKDNDSNNYKIKRLIEKWIYIRTIVMEYITKNNILTSEELVSLQKWNMLHITYANEKQCKVYDSAITRYLTGSFASSDICDKMMFRKLRIILSDVFLRALNINNDLINYFVSLVVEYTATIYDDRKKPPTLKPIPRCKRCHLLILKGSYCKCGRFTQYMCVTFSSKSKLKEKMLSDGTYCPICEECIARCYGVVISPHKLCKKEYYKQQKKYDEFSLTLMNDNTFKINKQKYYVIGIYETNKIMVGDNRRTLCNPFCQCYDTSYLSDDEDDLENF